MKVNLLWRLFVCSSLKRTMKQNVIFRFSLTQQTLFFHTISVHLPLWLFYFKTIAWLHPGGYLQVKQVRILYDFRVQCKYLPSTARLNKKQHKILKICPEEALLPQQINKGSLKNKNKNAILVLVSVSWSPFLHFIVFASESSLKYCRFFFRCTHICLNANLHWFSIEIKTPLFVDLLSRYVNWIIRERERERKIQTGRRVEMQMNTSNENKTTFSKVAPAAVTSSCSIVQVAPIYTTYTPVVWGLSALTERFPLGFISKTIKTPNWCFDSRRGSGATAAARLQTNTASLDKHQQRPSIRSPNKAAGALSTPRYCSYAMETLAYKKKNKKTSALLSPPAPPGQTTCSINVEHIPTRTPFITRS